MIQITLSTVEHFQNNSQHAMKVGLKYRAINEEIIVHAISENNKLLTKY